MRRGRGRAMAVAIGTWAIAAGGARADGVPLDLTVSQHAAQTVDKIGDKPLPPPSRAASGPART